MTRRRLRDTPAEPARPGESFLARFNRLKTEARQQAPAPYAGPDSHPALDAGAAADRPAAPTALTDADMPPLASLGFDSDFSGFLSPEVSDAVRKQALRKLFPSIELNQLDGLDEYAEDFTVFEPLGDLITADMRHQSALAQARRPATPPADDDHAPRPMDAPPTEDPAESIAVEPPAPASSHTDAAADIPPGNAAAPDRSDAA